ncbi:MAG: metallophosphoesterase [Clostridia bacterium]|nr:metallophosphoesterase [Clostridia bacterium]MBQ9774217.1 metallophosphoesterase [Clostridia bacterium]
MKLIHCADLHLDSPMESNLSSDKARERKGELRATFARLVRLAAENGADGILIAGDLFDSTHVTKSTEKYVRDLILSYPALRFFYLAGNHDRGNALKAWDPIPENLFLFGDGWTSYELEGVRITGSERPSFDTLALPDDHLVNILLLHGQERAGRGAAREDVIHLGKLKGKHLDYVALGHIHEYRTAQIDRRCLACYSGCLEGRGFDECGAKGYVLLEIENGRLSHRFVPMSSRTMHTVTCDVTDVTSQLDLEARVMAAVEQIPARDLVKVVLVGACPPEAYKDTVHLRAALEQRFYFAKIKDECRLLIRPEEYRNDISLKGEFVRRVMAAELSETERERVIACGLRALAGEELGL